MIRFFSTWTSILWNTFENKNFLNGNYFNFYAAFIDSGFSKYAETYEKNTEEIYRKAKNLFSQILLLFN